MYISVDAKLTGDGRITFGNKMILAFEYRFRFRYVPTINKVWAFLLPPHDSPQLQFRSRRS